MLDVRRFNDNIPGLKTYQDNNGDILTRYAPDSSLPILEVNFSNIARRVLGFFGLKEPPMEKYGVVDREGLIKKELVEVQAEIKTIESDPEMTKEASARVTELRARETELAAEVKAN